MDQIGIWSMASLSKLQNQNQKSFRDVVQKLVFQCPGPDPQND